MPTTKNGSVAYETLSQNASENTRDRASSATGHDGQARTASTSSLGANTSPAQPSHHACLAERSSHTRAPITEANSCETPGGVKIKQKLAPHGPATALILTDAQVTELGGGKRAAVTVTIAKKTVRLRLAVMGGKNMIGISKANREAIGVAIGVAIGDTVEATIELDGAARTVEVPDDAAGALAKAKLRKAFDALSFTQRKEYVRAITEAKKPETRAKRIEAMLATLRA